MGNTTLADDSFEDTSTSAGKSSNDVQWPNKESVDHSESQEELGRGKRKIRPTTILVDGQPVKVANHYEVIGERYVDLTAEGADERVNRGALFNSRKSRAPSSAQARKPGVSPAYSAIRHRNDLIHTEEKALAENRRVFLRQHLDHIAPFVSPDVYKRLVNIPKSAILPNTVLHAQPDFISGGEMRDYQLLGLRWLISRHDAGINAILADEMGLGKTLQTIALLAYLKFERKLDGPSLIVCPLSVLASWMVECQRWAPTLKVVQLHTSDIAERKRQCREILPSGKYDIAITTYEMVKNKISRHMLVQTIHWRYVVLDEGHIIKNENSGIAQMCRKLHFAHCLLLTGTPLQNNLHELYGILNFMLPDVFKDSHAFDTTFDLQTKAVDRQMLERAHYLLKPFMLRRLKADVERGLPARIETRVYCPLSEMQVFWYKRLLLKEQDILQRMQTQDKATASDWQKLQSLLMQLRKASNHPFLFPGAELNEQETTLDELIEASGKLQTLDRLLGKLAAKSHRVVVFSQFTHTLDIISDYLTGREYRFTRLDGSTNRIRRIINIDAFNAPGSPIFLFLMTTRAGGLGVNLQSADTVILYDSDWNPQADMQAMARVHRIGQTRVVHVYRLLSAGTIDERMVDHAEKKLYLSEHVNRDSLTVARHNQGVASGGENETQGEEAEAKVVLDELKFGADLLCRNQGNELLDDATLEAIIDRTRTGKETSEQLQSCKRDAASFDAGRQLQSTRALQGVDFEAPQRKPTSVSDIRREWSEIQKKREGKKRIRLLKGEGTGYGGAVPMLAENEYDWTKGASVFDRELEGKRASCQDAKRTKLMAHRDHGHEDFCAACQEGGSLVCCDFCPAAWHLSCCGMLKKHLPRMWSCPHHSCLTCGRKAAAAGGVIFRCLGCPVSFCFDHKPSSAQIVASNPRFECLGYPTNEFSCFVICSPECNESWDYIRTLSPPSSARMPLEWPQLGAEGKQEEEHGA